MTSYASTGRQHGHLAALAVFGIYAGAWVRAAARTAPAASGRLRGALLSGAATFRLSRLISKADITRPLRSPFTDVDEAGAPAELNETAKPSHPTLGALLSCPFCLGVWVAVTLTGAQRVWPREVEVIEDALAAVATADAMHLMYARLVRATENQPE
ncbi:DUF1360 domain-containing protein [Streptomyces sp. NPDC059650]|uniref:DUF1360 domain-containing protein n=1 Tax=Streptomyces sp. NPDC059650 TaxID=3346896 RepID=UPI003691A715